MAASCIRSVFSLDSSSLIDAADHWRAHLLVVSPSSLLDYFLTVLLAGPTMHLNWTSYLWKLTLIVITSILLVSSSFCHSMSSLHSARYDCSLLCPAVSWADRAQSNTHVFTRYQPLISHSHWPMRRSVAHVPFQDQYAVPFSSSTLTAVQLKTETPSH